MWERLRLYFHTLRYLTAIQFVFRLIRRFHRPRLGKSLSLAIAKSENVWIDAPVRPCSWYGGADFVFLNHRRQLDFPSGWREPSVSRLWLYHLHYFDYLRQDGSSAHKRDLTELILKWISDNPPTQGAGWEPYPTSLRIVNWIRWHLSCEALPQEALDSLALQARWLERNLEYHLLGNHLFVNAKALVFAGMFFEGARARRWLNRGLRLLSREISIQIHCDGGHFERSPMYHLLILEDILDLINLFQAYGRNVPVWLSETIPRMLHWAAMMRHPDGDIPFFNDSALGVAPSYGILSAYAERLGHGGCHEAYSGLLPDSGFARMQSGPAVLLIDCGSVGPDFQPGHAHAETLCFELSLWGRRVFVNSGISTYEAGEERLKQRSGISHNVLLVDGQNSSEVWSSFRVARRARVFDRRWEVSAQRISLSAVHDGYARQGVLHERRWVLDDQKLEITDLLRGKGTHRVDVLMHLHPDVTILEMAGKNVTLKVPGCHSPVVLTVPDRMKVSLHDYEYHESFGSSGSSRCVMISGLMDLPNRVDVRIAW